ncbi:hypothetical protein HKD37_02G005368 [Glycine soja]
MGSWSLEGWRLEFKWRKEWFDWELSVVEEFLNVLTNVNIANQGEDHWLEDSSSMYSIKSVYMALYDLRVGSNEIDIFKSLWQIKIPHKGNWWQTGWSAIVWAIWQKRNAMLFE